ncbi:hypothetical protein [Haloechinothrix sp. LS1_15]|uniref:hypothetical protein n=1 Tax=Haloechinothrix sp. LS1_15 TaxID=2652248 RepID=UPI00294487AD|nr:hypothetical protein [Haloechinothrix sp. LS1_15]MDV6012032.1 hypothetical protein [Haloechinothrix sp. LS1_15]
MNTDGIDDHPDLRGRGTPGWQRSRARRAARRQARRAHRRQRAANRPRRYRTAGLVVAMILAPVVVVAVVTQWGTVMALAGLDDAEETEVPREPPEETPTRQIPDAAVQLHQPFVGTPAAGWGDGIDGIEPPEPEPVGSFTADEVDAATEQVLATLEAAYLDRRVIEDHDIERYLDTLAPDARTEIAPEAESPSQGFGYTVRIADDHELLPASPKTAGELTVSPGEDGVLEFSLSLSVAYAFDTDEPDRILGSLDIVSVLRAEENYEVVAGDAFRGGSHGVWPGESDWHLYSIGCNDAGDGYLAPSYSDRALGGDELEHQDEFYFDPDNPLSDEDTC